MGGSSSSSAVASMSNSRRGPRLRGKIGASFPGEAGDSRGWKSGLVICLFGVAPWLSAPSSLDEARGFSRPDRQRRSLDHLGPTARDGIDEPEDLLEGREVRFMPGQLPGRGEEKLKRAHEAPPMQRSLRERMRNIQPYRDIVEQVERNHHGRGGRLRMLRARARQERPGSKKVVLTEVDKKAMELGSSRFSSNGLACLHREEDWPKEDPYFPEIAFAGRSNVGKSTLLNQMAMFGSVAAVSDMPGRTKHACWYRNRKVKMDIIDMPGYGYAQRQDMFGPDALEFVKKRKSIVCLYILIDARHGFKKADHDWLAELGREGPTKQIILTKCDLVPVKQLVKIASLVRADLEGHRRIAQKVLLASTLWGCGLHDIRKDMVLRCGKVPGHGKERKHENEAGDWTVSETENERIELMPSTGPRAGVAPGIPRGAQRETGSACGPPSLGRGGRRKRY